jgi:hypothetical protein
MKSPYFTSEHALFRQSLREFFRTECRPHFDSWEEARQIPRSMWRRLGDMGYLGLEHAGEWGGSAADFFYSVVFLEELARAGNGGFATAVSVHSYMATNHLARCGSPELKERFLKPAIAGEMIAALGISEPAAGSDVAGIRCAARREGDEYVVNGGKNFISNGFYADFIVTAVQAEEGISLLLIEGDRPGVTRTKLRKMGWHSSDTAEIGFADVRVPVSNLVGEPGKGFYYIMDSFQVERLAAGALALGAMDGILELTLRYMHEREAFGRPISRFQALRHQIADLATEVEACRQFVHHTAWLHTQGEYVVKECSMVKLMASELANKVVDRCLQLFGGYGYIEEYAICRAYRDARVGTIAGGTSEIMREIISKMVVDGVTYQEAYQEPSAAQAPDPAARQIVESLPGRFRADKAGSYETCIHYDISGPRGGQYTIAVAAGQCTVQPGFTGEARCRIRVADEVYEQLELGRLDAQSAFMQGLISASNPGELMQIARLFRKYSRN